MIVCSVEMRKKNNGKKKKQTFNAKYVIITNIDKRREKLLFGQRKAFHKLELSLGCEDIIIV